MGEPSPAEVRSRLLAWYAANRRDLPWRRTRDPYRILVAEYLLQRTRIASGTPYYERFLTRFPTVHDLAAASLDDVLAVWEGLGLRPGKASPCRGAGDRGGTCWEGAPLLRGTGRPPRNWPVHRWSDCEHRVWHRCPGRRWECATGPRPVVPNPRGRHERDRPPPDRRARRHPRLARRPRLVQSGDHGTRRDDMYADQSRMRPMSSREPMPRAGRR